MTTLLTVLLPDLNDKIYDRRKVAALELEKQVLASDAAKISAIIDQLCGMLSSNNGALHTRNGGLIGLAATAIALGQDVAPYLGRIIPNVLACFQDPESRLRYHACESFYNIAKVSKGEILVHFNEIFDALSKLSSDSEMSVKNGAELLDRLMKDIVAESAPHYVSIYPDNRNPNLPLPRLDEKERFAGSGLHTREADESLEASEDQGFYEDKRAFSLERFIPLLSERIYVISPFTRMHLVSWLMVLNSIPDLELVAWLPEFLDGLLKYLADGNVDVRLAAENVLAEFLREIKYIAQVQEKQVQEKQAEAEQGKGRPRRRELRNESAVSDEDDDESASESRVDDDEHEWEGEGSGAWVPGQGVFVDHAAIVEILIHNLQYDDELVQSTAMDWLLNFLEFAQSTVVAFTPQIVPAILPNLASPHPQIKLAAYDTNSSLYHVIQSITLQFQRPNRPITIIPANSAPSTAGSLSSTLAITAIPLAPIKKDFPSETIEIAKSPSAAVYDPLDASGAKQEKNSSSQPPSNLQGHKSRQSVSVALPLPSEANAPTAMDSLPHSNPPTAKVLRTRPESPPISSPQQVNTTYALATAGPTQQSPSALDQRGLDSTDPDPFDVRETVNVLTEQFLSDHAETRIAALEWLLMLHLKAPDKILARDSGTFPALLKTLSDPSEDVVKHDLQLLAQISASSDDAYFTSFMVKVLELFSTDRRLLEQRGSLIIRQLCLHLNAERIFRTIAEILEKDDDLEFAGMMVVKLNMILITSPELGDFRRRLKNLESRDGQMLFSSLYRSWCHNAVAAFSLCLLAQAYEHASNLLQIFADLELTVPLLVQIDKLVMLIESPVFTYLRLQLLEPDKYPWLPKCLYGLLMILPQSTAFISLRARLQVVQSSGYVPATSKTTSTTTFGAIRSKIGKEEIRWQELLSHFRNVQNRHEKARGQLQSTDLKSTTASIHYPSPSQTYPSTSAPNTAALSVGGKSGLATKKKTIGNPSQRQAGTDVGTGRPSGASSSNPKRGIASNSGFVGIGGAVASMNPNSGMNIRSGSPGRKKILGGLRKIGSKD
nr:vacuole morphology and inheritance protein 14 [Cryptococcus depauperatus CBS 7855]